jgi:hypothetical protein
MSLDRGKAGQEIQALLTKDERTNNMKVSLITAVSVSLLCVVLKSTADAADKNAYQFWGKLTAVNAAAKTFTVLAGKTSRIISVTNQTKIIVDGKRAHILESAKLGEQVSGVAKFQDGKLTAIDVIFFQKGTIPYAIRVPNKPNLVISLYTKKYFDVEGFPPGVVVLDPYTGKPVLVP